MIESPFARLRQRVSLLPVISAPGPAPHVSDASTSRTSLCFTRPSARGSLRGRALSDRDIQGAPPVLVINERLAQRYFEDADPVGERILIQEIMPGRTELGPDIAWEVVGVVANEKMYGLEDDRSAGVYVSNEQSPVYVVVLSVRASVDPLTLQRAITAAIHRVDKDQAVSQVRTVDQIADQAMVGDRLSTTLLGVFAADERTFRDMLGDTPHWQPVIDAGTDAFALSKRPTVLLVTPGLAGERAGLRAGDLVTPPASGRDCGRVTS